MICNLQLAPILVFTQVMQHPSYHFVLQTRRGLYV